MDLVGTLAKINAVIDGAGLKVVGLQRDIVSDASETDAFGVEWATFKDTGRYAIIIANFEPETGLGSVFACRNNSDESKTG